MNINEQSIRFAIQTAAIAYLVLSGTASAQVNCSTSTIINTNTTLSQDYVSTTGSNSCIRITGSGIEVDCNGHFITCNNASNCATAINVEQNNVNLHDCRIVSGTGNWNIGVANQSVSTDMDNLYVENAGFGVVLGAQLTNSVFVNISGHCISSGLSAFAAGTEIRQNYCQSDNDGIGANGPNAGSPVRIEENYVLAADVGILQTNGLLEVEKNIIDAANDFSLGDPGDVTLINNLCSDVADCPLPTDYPFVLDLTVN